MTLFEAMKRRGPHWILCLGLAACAAAPPNAAPPNAAPPTAAPPTAAPPNRALPETPVGSKMSASVGRPMAQRPHNVTCSEVGGDNPNSVERPIKTFAGPATTVPQPTFSEPLVPRSQTRAMVLMYHSIDKGLDIGTVWPWDFEAHIKRLRADHIEIISLSQLIAFLYGEVERLPARVAVITVDDGEVLFHKYAWPVLVRQKAPFTLSIITRPTELSAHAKALSWEQLNEMLASGLCEIASHGHMHLASTALKDDALDFELKRSRELIQAHTGVVPQAFVYPLGSFDQHVIGRVRSARYRAAFTAVGDAVSAGSPRFAIPRYRVQQNTAHNAFTRFFEREAGTP